MMEQSAFWSGYAWGALTVAVTWLLTKMEW